jgi:hypothetical protein
MDQLVGRRAFLYLERINRVLPQIGSKIGNPRVSPIRIQEDFKWLHQFLFAFVNSRNESDICMGIDGVVRVLLYVVVEEVIQRELPFAARPWRRFPGYLRRWEPSQAQVEQELGWDGWR